MNKFNKVAIIIPCHNKSLMTRMCIVSVFNQVNCQPLIVSVCDNNSQDDTWEMLKELQTIYGKNSLHICRNESKTNFGPARGNNIALKAVPDADLLIRCDNDTIFPTRFFGRFLEHAERRYSENKTIGVFCARPLEQDNFGTEDGTPNTPKIDDAPLGKWYYDVIRRQLQTHLTENTFFNEEQVYSILSNIYHQGNKLVNCPPTMDGYHEWVYNTFTDRHDLFPGGFTPALYAWTRDAVDSCPWHDEETFTHSDLEDNDYMYILARMGWNTCTFHDLFFHHWGSFTREYTGRKRAIDGMTMSELFSRKWKFFNEEEGALKNYILTCRTRGYTNGITLRKSDDPVEVPNPSIFTDSKVCEVDYMAKKIRQTRT